MTVLQHSDFNIVFAQVYYETTKPRICYFVIDCRHIKLKTSCMIAM